MTAVQYLSCSQSSLFWESFQTLCDEEVNGKGLEAQQHHSTSRNESSGSLLTSYSSISRVLGIIERAEDLMFSSNGGFLHDEDLEPIPIGPNGIQTIISTVATPPLPPTSSSLNNESTMFSDDRCHPAILMPTFLDMKNISSATTNLVPASTPACESLLDSFINTMKRDADCVLDSCLLPPMPKKQKTMRAISADTNTTSSARSVVSTTACNVLIVTPPPPRSPVSFFQQEEAGQEESGAEQQESSTTNDEDEGNDSTVSTMMNNNNNNNNNEEEEEEGVEPARFRRYQADQWMDRFDDLVKFKAETGSCLVPHSFPPNQQLAQWVKRQRYQHKLKMLGRHSTLTDERQEELEQMGFVWDSHKAAWDERLESLKKYCAEFGNCMVPTNYAEDRSLAVWVKCQRRQMKLFRSGRRSTMTQERFEALDRLGFEWNPRNL